MALVTAMAPCLRADEFSFAEDVRPVLEHKCVVCHQGVGAQEGLRVTTVEDLLRGRESGPAVVRGKPGESPLVAMAGREKPAMLPTGEPLIVSELDTIRAWTIVWRSR